MKTAQTSHRPLVPRTIAAHAALTATRIAGLTATLLAGLIPVAAQIAPSLPTPVQTASAITLSPFEVNTTKIPASPPPTPAPPPA